MGSGQSTGACHEKDFRIDFEDGYGNRPDQEEDGHAESAAIEVARGLAAGTLPPFIGIRIKPFNEELRARSMRTLDIFVSTVVAESGGRLPDNFVVTLPKITTPEQVAALADLFDLIEQKIGRNIETSIRRFEQKNGIRLNDEVRFIRSWIKKPLSMGAVTPSSKALARNMASYVDPNGDGPVIELGPGTGPVRSGAVKSAAEKFAVRAGQQHRG